MKRSTRKALAKETLDLVENGSYIAPSGKMVNFAALTKSCLSATRSLSHDQLEAIRQRVVDEPTNGRPASIEVANETTLGGIRRLRSSGCQPVAALNFASAKNPGGGFLNGSEAQEESLARNSALHASLIRAWDFYERHRASPSLLYSDAMILSPDCPVIRDDDGTLLEVPQAVTFITSAAPNAGAITTNRPEELSQLPATLMRRSEFVLALAASAGYKHLVLGAWGCGVFRNDPTEVAGVFMRHLRHANWSSRFERIVFSVLDNSPSQATLRAFQRAVDPTNG